MKAAHVVTGLKFVCVGKYVKIIDQTFQYRFHLNIAVKIQMCLN